mmetsp:Transcript_7246/g.15507  ORF Transcript_7246/g.15507 Transcript_7246/m.15507 type:complete len:204 (+) Transcript_7246:1683-2294(+)
MSRGSGSTHTHTPAELGGELFFLFGSFVAHARWSFPTVPRLSRTRFANFASESAHVSQRLVQMLISIHASLSSRNSAFPISRFFQLLRRGTFCSSHPADRFCHRSTSRLTRFLQRRSNRLSDFPASARSLQALGAATVGLRGAVRKHHPTAFAPRALSAHAGRREPELCAVYRTQLGLHPLLHHRPTSARFRDIAAASIARDR